MVRLRKSGKLTTPMVLVSSSGLMMKSSKISCLILAMSKDFREQAYLTRYTLTAIDERSGKQDRIRYYFEGGLKSYITYLNRHHESLGDIFCTDNLVDSVSVEVAMQYRREDYSEHLTSFVNNVITPGGGTHMTGFRTALTRTINKYVARRTISQKDSNLTNEDVAEVSVIICESPRATVLKGRQKINSVTLKCVVSSTNCPQKHSEFPRRTTKNSQSYHR